MTAIINDALQRTPDTYWVIHASVMMSKGAHWIAAVLNLDNLNIVQEPIVEAMMESTQKEIHNFDYDNHQLEVAGDVTSFH